METHEQHDNTMIPRTIGAIALRPSGNSQGGHYVLSLTTGKQILRNQWTVLPMPTEDVIERLHKMSRRSPELPALEFANRAGLPIDDDNDDSKYDDDNGWGDDDDYPDLDPDIEPVDDQITGVNLEQDLEPEELDEFEQIVELENVEHLDPPEIEQEIQNIELENAALDLENKQQEIPEAEDVEIEIEEPDDAEIDEAKTHEEEKEDDKQRYWAGR